MSSILRALKKLEHERSGANAAIPLAARQQTAFTRTGKKARHKKRVLACGGAAATILVFAVAAMFRYGIGSGVEEPAQSVRQAPPALEIQALQSGPPDATSERSKDGADLENAMPRPARASEPRPLPDAEPAPNQASASSTGAADFHARSHDPQPADESELTLQAIGWLSDPSRRSAIINNRVFHEGDRVDRYRIEEIQPEGVILSNGAQRRRLGF